MGRIGGPFEAARVDLRTCAAALWLLAGLLLFQALPERNVMPAPGCPDEERNAIESVHRARGSLPLVLCPDASDGRPGTAPRGAAGLLFGRRIDLNEATLEELQALPGIGPGLARRLVEDRERNGPFRSVDDLQRVRGIGPTRIGALRGLVEAGDR